jgi:hypothetical protein
MREERWLNISERQVYKVVAGHLATQVAREWARSTEQNFTQMTLSDSAWFSSQGKDNHFRAFFGGFDKRGKIGIVEVRIELIKEGKTFSSTVQPYEEDENLRYFAIGETQIASEFILLKTDRAKREYSQWGKTVRGEIPRGASVLEDNRPRSIDD